MKHTFLFITFALCSYFNAQYNVTGVPYFYQYSNSINPGGSCQNTSIAMILKFNGFSGLTPDQISNQYGTSQAQTVSGFNTVCNSVAQNNSMGANCVSTSNGSFQAMRNILATGKPVVVHGYFTSYGHVLVVTGYTGTHYICNDPAGQWTQVYQVGYTGSSSTVGNQIQYGKAAFEQAIGPDNTLWYHYYNTPTCTQPTGLFTQEITSTSAKMKWSQVIGAGSYNVRYRQTGTTTWSTNITYFNELVESSLSPFTTYEFQVQTNCGSYNSAYSSVNTFTTLAPPCSVPTGLNTPEITHNSAKMKWTQASGALSYNVRYRKTGVTTWTTALTYYNELVATGLNAQTSYEFQVQTNCDGTVSNYSAISTFTTIAVQCSAPTALLVTNVTSNGATVNWTGSSFATSYNLRYRVSGSATWTNMTSATNTKALTGLSSSTSYVFQVQSVCTSGTSNFVSGSFTTSGLQPVTLQIGNGTTNYSGHPYSSSFMDELSQYIITKEELVAAGWAAQTPVLQSIAFQVSTNSSTTLNSFTVRVSHTSAASYANGNYLAGTTSVSTYTGIVTTANGWNTYNFGTPFNYNQTMNLVITISFNNSTVGSNSIVVSSILNDYKALFRRENLSAGAISNTATGTKSYYRPNMRLKFGPKTIITASSNTKAVLDETNETINLLEKKSLVIYPNPMNSSTTVRFSTDLVSENPLVVRIYDQTGRVIYTSDNFVLDSFENTIELDSSLDEGIYFLNILNPTDRLTEIFQVIR